MNFATRFFYKKSFWFLLSLGFILSTGQMPIDMPFLAFFSLVLLAFAWTKYDPDCSEALIWGFGFGLGYFGFTFFWIVEPFLVLPMKTGWLAPVALFLFVVSFSLILSLCFYLASRLGQGATKNKKLTILFLFFFFSDLIRSELLFDFPWGIVSAMWINTPISQSLAIVGPYWLSGLTILSAFLLSRLWLPFMLGLGIMFVLYGFGHNRLNIPVPERAKSIKVRVVQPNVEQSEKWKPELAAGFLKNLIGLSKSASENGIDIIIWPETALSYEIQDEKKLREFIWENVGVVLILGARRFDKANDKFYNSAFMLADKGNILALYDKVRLVPFGEYIPFGNWLAEAQIFGLAVNGLRGFSSGVGASLFETKNLGKFRVLICYEAIFSEEMQNTYERPSWMAHITNDAWFGSFSGPQQHLTLARMRAVEQGIPVARSANTGISAIIGPYGRIQSALELGNAGYIDGFLPAPLKPTLYSRVGPRFLNGLLIGGLMLTNIILILITVLRRLRHNK